MEAIALFLVVFCLICSFWFTLFRKAGYATSYSVFMAIGMCVPLVNVLIAIGFACTTWPIRRELAALRRQAGIATEDDVRELLFEASRLEIAGRIADAVAKYEVIQQRFPGTEAAADAEASIRSLRSIRHGPCENTANQPS